MKLVSVNLIRILIYGSEENELETQGTEITKKEYIYSKNLVFVTNWDITETLAVY